MKPYMKQVLKRYTLGCKENYRVVMTDLEKAGVENVDFCLLNSSFLSVKNDEKLNKSKKPKTGLYIEQKELILLSQTVNKSV